MTNLTPNSSFSVTLRLQIPNRVGMLASVTQAIASSGGNLGQIDLIEQNRQESIRDITVDAASTEQAETIVQAVKELIDIKVIDVYDRTFNLHRGGKISIASRIPLKSVSDLAMAYTPGVGRICKAIAENPEEVYHLTIKQNTVAIVTDGSAVLGLGNLGPGAALPVMEGKAMLFKEFAGIDAFPICLDTQDTEEIIKAVKNIAPVFGGVNLEDIAAPRCFEIEKRLQAELDIPIFHDDQNGTAIVTLAALLNALKLVHKSIANIRIVINGAGAAGIAVARLLRKAGAEQIWMCDSKGIISINRTDLNDEKREFAVKAQGTLAGATQGADVFIGLSGPGVLTPEMVQAMTKDAIVFAMANPIPEIQPELVPKNVAVMATGRSDYPNQINNVLAFPGVFRGALDCRAKTITTNMCLEAANAIASLVKPSDLNREHIIPSVFDERVSTAVAAAVKQAAREEGIAQS
ncbi:ACT domain-containing protein [Sphaerospermopsis kisseleviana CS-549]|jgi:malate dehydrogenase (oxaloacetate-decarboxylating)|uniref:Malate dehydrogenase n=3 Tax=Sphaerospermopsis TaxID=752201 RepID=A0A480A9G6_9CYAN|nr:MULTISPECIES: malic enzyme-like NAD(P)-binding protein [Sphaerospermopsis]BAZ80424.1 malate dehydrogenase (oxaloacetate-decarboxylating) [Sphaerospermopsis kisseleviana NIES-73]MBD2133642.1 NAD-dependent malic enzyme [Sphaerospermopsis sp. FACHB-1094]MBD2145815.1 NAD-dependent malic enzyme [Sphaerospermopsis sp. FACHB-1194]MBE9235081.1 NAD-dependent malic enzyme [Sphaerospermopsis aphanizomenoides LEGE 00250]MDB9440354.1 ACT domain-containing protein [Sphaerospermopsis kisseleviana CS-549]